MLNPESQEQYRTDKASCESARSSWQEPGGVPEPETAPNAAAPLWQPIGQGDVLNQISQVINGMGALTQQAFGATLANAMVSWMTNSGGSLLSLMFLN